MRKGITLVEFIFAVLIILCMALTIFGVVGGCNPSEKSRSNGTIILKGKCTGKYTQLMSKKVELQLENGEVLTISCDDDYFRGITNSKSLYATFEQDKWFEVTAVGKKEGLVLPKCKQVKSISETNKD